jgi:capsular polysaccharide export protein
VLGDAVYDIPRITHQGGLDGFWETPSAPEAKVYDAFRRVLIDRCLVHGGYFSEDGLRMLVEGSVARLEAVESLQPIVRLVSAGRPAAGALAARG